MTFGSIGETIKKFAGSAVEVGVADAVGVAVQTFFLPVLTQLKVLPLITFFSPICLQGEPFLIVAASEGIEDAASKVAITRLAKVFLIPKKYHLTQFSQD